jgi:hypothetical protein
MKKQVTQQRPLSAKRKDANHFYPVKSRSRKDNTKQVSTQFNFSHTTYVEMLSYC